MLAQIFLKRGRTSIKPGKPLRVRLNKRLPAAVTVGTYFFIVQIDPGNLLHDTNVANNTQVSSPPAIAVS